MEPTSHTHPGYAGNTTDPDEPIVETVHLYVLLDRSGSMESIRSEVISGFNAFVAGQQVEGADARMTLVQFDSVDVQEVVFENLPIRQVRPLRSRHFQPRGSTPLLDATGQLIALAKAWTVDHAVHDGRAERVVLVTITDGLENASREFTRQAIRDLVAEREAKGWTFVYLSAALDAYDEAGSLGYAPGSVQAFAPDGDGAQLAFSSLTVAMTGARRKIRAGVVPDARDVFEGVKPAELDRRAKRGDTR